jgi:hypothetical protein
MGAGVSTPGGGGGGFQGVNPDGNPEYLAKLADDAAQPSVVGALIRENEINVSTALELEPDDLDEISDKKLTRKKLSGALKRLKEAAPAGGANALSIADIAGSVALAAIMGRRVALLCAIDDYSAVDGLGNLHFAVADLRLYEKTLKKIGFEVITLINAACTSGGIETAFKEQIAKFKGQQVAQFFFGYTGHSVQDEKSGRGWIAPFGFDGDRRRTTSLRMERLNDLAEDIGARQQMWVFDCCHAGALMRGARGEEEKPLDRSAMGPGGAVFTQRELLSPAIRAVTAVTGGELALEEGGNGVFTKVFCQGLLKCRPDGSPFCTASELFAYTVRRVREKSRGKMHPQTGMMLLDHEGDPVEGQFLVFDGLAAKEAIRVAGGAAAEAAAAAGEGSRGGGGGGGGGSSSGGADEGGGGGEEEKERKRRQAEARKLLLRTIVPRVVLRAIREKIGACEESQDCAGVVAVMRAEAGEARAQECGCQAVRGLMRGAWGEEKKKAPPPGCVEAVLAALARFGGEDPQVAEQGCGAVRNLAANDAANRKAIASAGGIAAVLSALRAHGGSHAGVAVQGCGALRNLAFDADNRKAIGSEGGIAAVLSALRALGESHARVAKQGCAALRNLAANDADNQKSIESAGGIAAVMSALRAHSEVDAEMALQVCGFLFNLAYDNTDNEKAIVSAGGIAAVVSALRAHGGSHAGVARQGCSALKNLSYDATSVSSLKSKSSGVRPAVETAMSAHSSNAKIQELGAFVLNKLGQ